MTKPKEPKNERSEAQQKADERYRENTQETRVTRRVVFNRADDTDRKRDEWLQRQGVMSDAIKALIDAAMQAEGGK